jgi:two-component system nitrogen regulation response regulator GlnG
MTTKRVLVADGSSATRLQLAEFLIGHGHQVRASSDPATVLKWLEREAADLAILEAAGDGRLDAVQEIRKAHPKLPIILTSANISLSLAFKAASVGAIELLAKPLQAEQLRDAIELALASTQDPDAAEAQARAGRHEALPIIGAAQPMQRVYRRLARLTASHLPVLIWGETGVGKTMAAETLHDLGRQRHAPFVRVLLAGSSEASLERQLLGDGQGPGRLAQARGGVLFLENVDDLGWERQGQLISILDRASSRTPGAPSAARLISSAQRDLRAAVQGGDFREDLYLRLAAATVRVPPLRERREDIPDLARALLARAAREGAPAKQIDAAAVGRLQGYDWPGNVRELDNTLRRLCAYHSPDLITGPVVEREMAAQEIGADPLVSLSDFVERRLSTYLSARAPDDLPVDLHEAVLAMVEKPLLKVVLSAAQGSHRRAAEVLGLHRTTLRRKLQDLGLASPDGAFGADEAANDVSPDEPAAALSV